jgi:hypothetical protein
MGKARKHPMQKIVFVNNVARFQRNKIVEFLLDNGSADMNFIAALDFDREDRAQFAQLIGYSVSGYGDLSYAIDVGKADRQVERVKWAIDEQTG